MPQVTVERSPTHYQGLQGQTSEVRVEPPPINLHLTTPSDFQSLEDRIKAIEGYKTFGYDASELCLVPNVVLPPKFKIPDFEKYKGLSCPKDHLIMYCRKMGSYANDDKLLIHCFQESLRGASLKWYMNLERSKIRTWKDLTEAFMNQYRYNMDMAPNRMQLQNLSKGNNEPFKEYAQRWRELASQVQPPLIESELIDMFTNTLPGPYYDKMVGSVSAGFSDLVKIGERIENGLKNGKIQFTSGNQDAARKHSGGFQKKKEGETNAVMSGKGGSYQAPSVEVHYRPQPQRN